MRGITCDAKTEEQLIALAYNDLVNGGKVKQNGEWKLDITRDQVFANCKKATADQAMQFVTFGFTLVTIVLVFLVWKNGRSGGRKGTYV